VIALFLLINNPDNTVVTQKPFAKLLQYPKTAQTFYRLYDQMCCLSQVDLFVWYLKTKI